MTYDEVENGVRESVASLFKAAAEYTVFFENGPHRKAYLIARKLCSADGYDPDRVSMGHAGAPATIDAKKAIAIILPIRPNWMLYMPEALTAIEFVESTDA